MTRIGEGAHACFIHRCCLVLLLLLFAPGCFRGGRGPAPGAPPEPPSAPIRGPVSDNGSTSWNDLNPTVVRIAEPGGDNVAEFAPATAEAAAASGGPIESEKPSGTAAAVSEESVLPQAATAPPAETTKIQAPAEVAEAPSASLEDNVSRREPPVRASVAAKKPKQQPSSIAALTAAKDASPAFGPAWAMRKEELVYRVDFIGITMGYARFRYQGKVSVGGKVAYHLNVRAWTSGVLSYIYPVNETIDYYLDAETLAPLRQEFTQREREKDDVATYEQGTGKITYRYRDTGEVRKRVDTVPMVYDPVSVAYYFRWRDLGGDERSRNVYAGRKVWQISARVLGKERLRTDYGEVDTVLIQPVIRRDGKLEDKGDLKMWLSSDERHVPVRLYAKFRKIRDWTLVGELVPQRDGG